MILYQKNNLELNNNLYTEDAADALKLAKLHNKPDSRSKVYSKFPSLRKNAEKAVSKSEDIDKEIIIMMGNGERGGCLNC